MATVDRVAVMKEMLISRHTELIDQLETKYMSFIVELLEQKKEIIQQMQRKFYKELENVHSWDKQLSKSNTNAPSLAPKNTTFSELNTFIGLLQEKREIIHQMQKQFYNQLESVHSSDKHSFLGGKALSLLSDSNAQNSHTKTLLSSLNKSVILKIKPESNNQNKENDVSLTNGFQTQNQEITYISNEIQSIADENLSKPINTSIDRSTEQFQCTFPFCGQRFETEEILGSHIRIHSSSLDKSYKIKYYKCEQCNKAFTTKQQLTSHVYIHSGQKPYQCQLCKKEFVSKDSWNKHIEKEVSKKRKNLLCKKVF